LGRFPVVASKSRRDPAKETMYRSAFSRVEKREERKKANKKSAREILKIKSETT